MAFTDAQISKWAADYEKELVAKHDLVCDRISLQIISGFNEYELPNYVTNIRSVLYKGKELHPKGFRAAVLTNNTPFETAGAVPYEYMFSGKGLRVLKFYPSPNENVAEYVGDLFSVGADTDAVIVEFYRTPDSTDLTKQLPTWCRRYLLKDYVCWKAATADGPKQDIRMSTYYRKRLDMGELYINEIKTNMHQATMYVMNEAKMLARRKPGRPVLPPNFGFKVNG